MMNILAVWVATISATYTAWHYFGFAVGYLTFLVLAVFINMVYVGINYYFTKIELDKERES